MKGKNTAAETNHRPAQKLDKKHAQPRSQLGVKGRISEGLQIDARAATVGLSSISALAEVDSSLEGGPSLMMSLAYNRKISL